MRTRYPTSTRVLHALAVLLILAAAIVTWFDGHYVPGLILYVLSAFVAVLYADLWLNGDD